MANVFGVISPKVSKINVIIPVTVAIAVARLLIPSIVNTSIVTAVARADDPMFAILLPISIPVIRSLGLFSNLFRSFVPLIFWSVRLLNFTRLNAVNAVSELEKNADKNIKKTNVINFTIDISGKCCQTS